MNRFVVVAMCTGGLALSSALASHLAFAQQSGGSAEHGQNEPREQSEPRTQSGQGDAAQLAHGKAVFDKWCAPCHSVGPGMPGTAALQALYRGQKPALLEQRTDLAPEITKTFVRNGVSVMPFFRKTEISDADLDALAAYLAQ
jgi:mono/diheme cytochrome c family protein